MSRRLPLVQPAELLRGKSSAGYTVIEVLIVLGVTTVLFVAIALTFAGRQRAAVFSQSLRDYETRLQGVISDVSSGYIDFDPSRDCNGLTAPGVTQGTSENCIFLGKVFASQEDQSTAMTVIANREVSGLGREIRNLSEANLTVLFDQSRAEIYRHKFTFKVKRIFIIDASGGNASSVGSFAILSQLGNDIAGGQNPLSGSRSLRLYGVGGTSVSTTFLSTSTLLNSASLLPANNGIRICGRGGNGAGEDKVEIIIGGGASNTSIRTLINQGIENAECRRDD